jgi:pimeloyl-ACP methyl ester carboxylesterase
MELEHHRAGSGEPLVLIHGIGSCWQVWRPVLPLLEASHEVLALSLPGYGRSAPLAGEPTVPALVDAVEEAMDGLGLDTAHLVGNSLGGWIAAELAARGRARSVVALSPAGLWTRRELAYSRRTLHWSWLAARRIAPHAELIARSAIGRWLAFGRVSTRPWRLEPDSAAYQLRAYAGSPSFPRTLRWIEQNRAMPRGLERIGCPFLVAWGSWDLLLPLRQSHRWERLVPGARRLELQRLGHVPMPDDAELVARTILDWTAAAGRPATPSPGRRAAAPG